MTIKNARREMPPVGHRGPMPPFVGPGMVVREVIVRTEDVVF
jgi:hypothetical protein